MNKRFPELDGLRGAAILMVMLQHYVAESTNAGRGTLSFALSRFSRLGWTGVDLFFVLSGFLIGGILLDARKSPNYFKTFYMRRAHRILPVYYLWLALYAVAAYVGLKWVTPQDSGFFAFSVPIAVYILFFQNFIFKPISLFGTYVVGPTWSLAVEEQFYLISPWLIRYLSPRYLVNALILFIITAPVLRGMLFNIQYGHRAVYFLTPCRIDGLAMGMLVAIAWRTRARAWIAKNIDYFKAALLFFLIGTAAMLRRHPDPTTPFQAMYQYSWIACLFSLVVVVALLAPSSLVARFSRSEFLRNWGRISYCVYLIHLAILAACHLFVLRSLPRITDWPGVITTILAAVLTWLLAQISWHYLEKPLLDQGHSFKY